ncbi:iron(3+)-hydroxamate import ATP-binding protein FhuC [mine drainage metagenome]|uniref:Iron(3+)-hydroxamate import ATP-binding protein FhuC n=1 Tax=mine drainage metagenome TaxID=410659 RepID=A0A1J5S4E9_9ZZZZ
MTSVNPPPLLSARRLEIAVGDKTLVRSLDLSLNGGDTLAILGRNGSGKTTLLTTLAGLRLPSGGDVELLGEPYAAHEPRAAARLRGLLTQMQTDAFPASVLETALIGRHPHLSRWAWEGLADERIAREALAAVGLEGLEEREVHTLSGGERQRLGIATLLTQQPLLYLLDEPLAHLDLAHQIAMLELMKRYAAECRAGFVIVLHDMNLARRYCRRALLLFGDGRWREGASEEVLTAENLSELYGQPLRELPDGDSCYFVAA